MSGPGANNPYLRRPAAPAASRGPDGLADVLERVLDKGLVIAGDIQINLLDIELLTIKVRLLLASADTAQQMGIDWWKHDPFLTGKDRELAQENSILRERVDQLEAAMGAKLAPGEPSPGDLVGEGATDREAATRGQPIPTGAMPPRSGGEDEDGDGDDAEEADEELGGDKTPDPAIAAELQRRGGRPEVEVERIHLEPSDEGSRLEVTEADDGSIEVTAETDWESYTKVELQDELRERGLPTSGNKPELIERLREDDDAEEADEEPGGDETPDPGGEDRPEVEAEHVHLEPSDEDSTLEVTEADDGSIEVTAETDWESYTKVELQDELRERGLPTSGNKPELIERLREDDDAEEADEEPGGDETPDPGGEDRPEVEAEHVHLEPSDEDSTLEVTEADDGSIEVTAETDWESYTKVELQDELRERGLPTSGNKPELIERLREDG